MKLVDLRYSNSVYIYRVISKQKMTVDEIAKATDMTPLTVNKILKSLIKSNIVSKSAEISHNKRFGRPNIYYEPSSCYYTALILHENNKMLLYYVSANGKIKQDKKSVGKVEKGTQTVMANVISNRIDKENPFYLGTYLVSDDIESFDEVKNTRYLQISELIAVTYSDEEKVVFIDHDDGKVLINHSKAKDVELSSCELEKVIDIDKCYDLRGKSRTDIIFDGVKVITKKLTERKI